MPIQYLTDQYKQQSWGTQKRTSEFRLFAVPIFNVLNPLDITGFQIIDVSYDEERGTATTDRRWKGGNLHYHYSATPTTLKNITATLKYPHGLWTFIDGILEFSPQGNCFALMRVPECTDECERYFDYFEVVYGQARELSIFVGVNDNNQVVDRESELIIYYAVRQWNFSRFAIISGFNPLYGATFMVSGCPGCTCDPLKTVYSAGGDGVTQPQFYQSDDAFGETTQCTSIEILSDTDVPTGIWANQYVILIPFANSADPLLGTTGGILYSYDGRIWNMAVDGDGADLTEPIYFIRYANGKWIAGGGNSTLLESMNGKTWRPITHTLTGTFVRGGYDSQQVKFYIAGFNGAAGLAVELDGRNLVRDISADVNPPGRLYTVAVLGGDQVVFGGEYGAFIESLKATQYHYTINAFGAADQIVRAIQGNAMLTYFAMDNELFQRNIFTGMEISSLDTGLMINGNIQDIAMVYHPTRGNIKRLRAVTDQGEVISFEDCVPDTCSFLQVQREMIESCLSIS